ncbi:ISAs1-like element IS1358 family transposase [Vibrio cholerae]|uniref:ISAs1-like element IS1358 family transposase n=1 Tax=Vibrio cholerae TaxID=666 RepID=UPI00155E82F9|nr:ISAs1-like element IS1358 family transposase [Vibrio cholerae]EGR0538753.1 ISAs1 family transposase [Vibrio cholerae]EGR3956183.1 ISAs1 family transposase [Vibrio cholerae]EGR3989203.1 ISAs1 family transposase [Vibrio cholerae]EKB3498620.1 ISAs1 family transposase [Vibrio cholerae]EKF9767668.1 ISAs1 family transposase [Vibrio cholerae]
MSELINPFMHFQIIKGYRQESKVEHKLSDIILLTICGVLSGHDGWDGIIDFGHARLDFLKRYGHFEAGIPSADTLSRVMGMINPVALQRSFIAWMKDCHTLTDGEVIAIDGKTLRGSYDRSKGKGTIHMVNAFATANRMSIGQLKVDSKSNEITAIPKLLDLLDVKGCLITIDAMGCQKKIAQKILDKEADYLLAVKGNQGMLEQAFDDYFRMDMLQDFDGSSYSTQEKSHGRIETRVALVNRDLSVLGDIEHEWPGLKSMGIVASIRQESAVATEQDVSIRYYICSKELEAQTLLEATRSHWGVEVMHWSLDTAFCEDNSRIRADDRAEAFARIRQICLNLLKSETTFKGGIKRKRMNCAMDEKYLSKVLESLT